MWFDLAVLWGSSKLIWSRLRSHIPPQQTTVIGGLLVQVRGLDCASGEPILRQSLGVFMGIEQAWLKVSLAPFLAPTKYR